MTIKDPVAAAAQKYKPMQSAVPGTTLGPIQIEVFQGGGAHQDTHKESFQAPATNRIVMVLSLRTTPGVHLHHREAAVVHSEDLPILAPQSRLRGQSFPALSAKNIRNDLDAVGLNGTSIFWGGLVRIDVVKVLPNTRLTFYGPQKVAIHMVRTSEADEFYHRECGLALTPPTGKQRETWTGLQATRQLQIKFEDRNRPACDVAISGLGWIAVETFGLESNDENESEEFTWDCCWLYMFRSRSRFSFGHHCLLLKLVLSGTNYQELTDKEEELRSKWYY